MTKTTLAILAAGVLIAGAIMFSGKNTPPSTQQQTATAESNVTMENGTQVIAIDARGGYSPRQTTAKAGIPTIIRMNTQGTFDCSSAVRIPSIGYEKNLPASGTTDIPVPAQQAGETLKGLCIMGMYNFSVTFE